MVLTTGFTGSKSESRHTGCVVGSCFEVNVPTILIPPLNPLLGLARVGEVFLVVWHVRTCVTLAESRGQCHEVVVRLIYARQQYKLQSLHEHS